MQIFIKLVGRKSITALVVAVLITTGCVSTKRDCPKFYHPDYAKWGERGGVGGTLIFADQNGVKESFDVIQIESRAPFRVEARGSRLRDIPCGLTLREVLVKQGYEERILKEFTHFDYQHVDLTSENFWLRVFIDDEEFQTSDFVVNLKSRKTVIDENEFADRFHSQIEIGGVLYKDVITQEILDETHLEEPDQIRTVAFAKGVGLVQYERVNGSVFSRVAE